jgi:transposase
MQSVHVGIDISKATFNAAYRCSKAGKECWMDSEFTNDDKGFRALVAWAGPQASFAMEATGLYHVNAAMYLHGKGRTVHVSNPLQIKRFSQMQFRRAKTDKADARVIAEFLDVNAQRLGKWNPPAENLAKARSLLSVLRLLKVQGVAKSHSMQALRLTPAGCEVAVQLEVVLEAERAVILAMEKDLVELVRVSHAEEFDMAQTIGAIGPKTAAAVILATDGLRNFDSSRQLSAYFGMSPRQFQSGTSVNGKGHICKMGNPYVRSLLYICAVSSLKHNRPCKDFYDSLLARGKPKKVALVAVANKLLRILFAVMKKRQPWNPKEATA